LKRVRNLILVLIALLAGSVGSAQNEPARKVLIPLIVKDAHHQLIGGLTQALLVFTDQKVPVVDVSLLRSSDLPLELGVIIDTSRSEQQEVDLKDIVGAAKNFVNDAIRTPQDRVFFLAFNTVPQITGWLKKEQLAGLSLNLTAGGGTALYDAVAMACQDRMGTRDLNTPTRRVLVVISDGQDNQSHITRDEATTQALKSGVVIFTLGTQFSGPSDRGEHVLKNWAKVTGGEFFTDITRKHSTQVFTAITEVLSGMYYASYVPPSPGVEVHELEIKPARKEKLELTYPGKYFWPQ
jgi:Ca-activated chloride channel family protein